MKCRLLGITLLFCISVCAYAQNKIVIANLKTSAKISQREAVAMNMSFFMNFQPKGYSVIDEMDMCQLIEKKHVSCDTLSDGQKAYVAQYLGYNKLLTGEIHLIGEKISVEVNVTDLLTNDVINCIGSGYSINNYEKAMRTTARKVASKLKTQNKSGNRTNSPVNKKGISPVIFPIEDEKNNDSTSLLVEQPAQKGAKNELENEILSHHKRKCLENKVVDADGNSYQTVYIGNQCWMKENMRSTHDHNGKRLIFYAPNNNYGVISTYGYLYDWGSAKNVCPPGWHLPSDKEWVLLEQNISHDHNNRCDTSNINIAKAMCSTWGWERSKSDCAIGNEPTSNNTTGFGILPSGLYNSGYFGFGVYTNFWSSTELQSGFAFSHGFNCNNANVIRYVDNKESGFSVRCLKN